MSTVRVVSAYVAAIEVLVLGQVAAFDAGTVFLAADDDQTKKGS